MSKKETVREGTTIGLLNSTQGELDDLKNKWRLGSYDAVIQRLLRGQTDVYIELLAIDNELPQLHTATFQLGEDTNSIYFWDGQITKTTTLEEANKKLKEPKPNITITLEEAKNIIATILDEFSDEVLQSNTWERLAEYVKDAESRKVL